MDTLTIITTLVMFVFWIAITVQLVGNVIELRALKRRRLAREAERR